MCGMSGASPVGASLATLGNPKQGNAAHKVESSNGNSIQDPFGLLNPDSAIGSYQPTTTVSLDANGKLVTGEIPGQSPIQNSGDNNLQTLIAMLQNLMQTVQQMVGQYSGNPGGAVPIGTPPPPPPPVPLPDEAYLPVGPIQNGGGGFVTRNYTPGMYAGTPLGGVLDRNYAQAQEVVNTAKQDVARLQPLVSAPVDYSKVTPDVAARLQDLHKQVENQTDFIANRVLPTMDANTQAGGMPSFSAGLKVSMDTVQLETLDRFVRKMADAGQTLKIADLDKFGQASSQGNMFTAIMDIRTSLRVRDGNLSIETAAFLTNATKAIEDQKNFIDTKAIPTIYDNAQRTGSLNQSALDKVNDDKALLAKALDRAMDIFYGGKTLTAQDAAQASSILQSGDIAGAIENIAGKMPVDAPTS